MRDHHRHQQLCCPDLARSRIPGTGHRPELRHDGPGNSIIPTMDNTLIYVISESTFCPLGGGPTAPNPTSTTSQPVPIPCTYLTFVNATTGRGLGAMSGPGLKAPSHY